MDYLTRVFNESKIINSRFSLADKNAVVVGGNKGLGQAMSLALAGAGANVCIVGRGPEGLSETAEAVNKLGRKGMFIAADVTDEAQVISMKEKIVEDFGTIDILVNSQGTTHLESSVDFPIEKWEHVINVNLRSVFLCCKHIGEVMLKNGRGKIINVASVRAFQGRAKDPAYAISKGGVIQLTRSLAIEWGKHGINVNGIAPVFTVTALSEDFLKNKQNKDWVLSRIPMNRLSELEDVMGPVVFLASDASGFINGHTLPVDGGWLSA
jgi:2-dehydro-3-deoxy-D-gluconate 5-dehydrogenase